MSKNKEEVKAINNRIKEINRLLKHLVEYAISWLDGIEKKLASDTTKRRTKITNIRTIDVKAVTKRDMPLKYDEKSNSLVYIGFAREAGYPPIVHKGNLIG